MRFTWEKGCGVSYPRISGDLFPAGVMMSRGCLVGKHIRC